MKMRFKCSNSHITCIVIVLIILLLSPMFFFKKQSPYMLMEGMKNKKEGLTNKNKEGLASKPASKEGFANIEGSNNPSIFSMLFFKDTKFKPQCCPSSYSNSMGCACINNSQYKYLIERGGNNVPFSEY
jgi:hypothetical protein